MKLDSQWIYLSSRCPRTGFALRAPKNDIILSRKRASHRRELSGMPVWTPKAHVAAWVVIYKRVGHADLDPKAHAAA